MGRKLSNPKTMQKKLRKILADPFLFIPRLKIKNKKGKLVRFKLNAEQEEMLKAFTTMDEHMIILKARQIGSSTLVSAYLFWLWFTSEEPITVAILSHKLASSKHLLEMWFRFYDNLPPQIKGELEVRNTTSMRLPSGAEVIAVSAEGKGGLRSFSANYIHLSEYAFAPNADELKATAIASLNDGRLFQESTANVFGDPHHVDILKAQRGEANLHLLFFPWTMHEEYRSNHRGCKSWTDEEKEAQVHYGLDLPQLYWRRTKIQQLGYHKFIREYPASIDEAYAGHSQAYFSPECFAYLNNLSIEPQDDYFNIFADYSKENAYAIGVDVGGGSGGDPSCIVVMDKVTYEPVAIWSSNTTSIIETADRLEHIGYEYGEARILIEENSIGSALLNEMRNRGYTNLWKNPQNNKDWNTNVKTKFLMFEELKEALKQGVINNLDTLTHAELRAYYLNDKGRIDYPKNLPTHGDRVVALALALQCLKQVSLPKVLDLPHWVRARRAERVAAAHSFHTKRRYN